MGLTFGSPIGLQLSCQGQVPPPGILPKGHGFTKCDHTPTSSDNTPSSNPGSSEPAPESATNPQPSIKVDPNVTPLPTPSTNTVSAIDNISTSFQTTSVGSILSQSTPSETTGPGEGSRTLSAGQNALLNGKDIAAIVVSMVFFLFIVIGFIAWFKSRKSVSQGKESTRTSFSQIWPFHRPANESTRTHETTEAPHSASSRSVRNSFISESHSSAPWRRQSFGDALPRQLPPTVPRYSTATFTTVTSTSIYPYTDSTHTGMERIEESLSGRSVRSSTTTSVPMTPWLVLPKIEALEMPFIVQSDRDSPAQVYEVVPVDDFEAHFRRGDLRDEYKHSDISPAVVSLLRSLPSKHTFGNREVRPLPSPASAGSDFTVTSEVGARKQPLTGTVFEAPSQVSVSSSQTSGSGVAMGVAL